MNKTGSWVFISTTIIVNDILWQSDKVNFVDLWIVSCCPWPHSLLTYAAFNNHCEEFYFIDPLGLPTVMADIDR